VQRPAGTAAPPYATAGDTAHSAPPIHGPITDPAWSPREPHDTALGNFARGTSIGPIAPLAGDRKARDAPKTTALTKIGNRSELGCSARAANRNAQTISMAVQINMIARRSRGSAVAPVINVSRNSGTNCARPTMPTRKALCATPW
jgi:hypothetical protein